MEYGSGAAHFNRVDESHVARITEGVATWPAGAGGGSISDGCDVRAMQIHDAYLVVETDEGLTVVDQHALHERILYEQLRNRVLAGTVESQRLLVPQPVELSTAEAALLSEHSGMLAQFGLCLEEFGTNTVLVTAYPVMLSRVEPAQMVRDAAEKIAESGRDPSRRDLLDSLLHMLSCKAAVKAGQRLSPEEIDSLLAQRHLIDDAHHCPHGRPTALVLSRTELDRQFGRLG
jgi:DNA mismatch repair protein MutL